MIAKRAYGISLGNDQKAKELHRALKLTAVRKGIIMRDFLALMLKEYLISQHAQNLTQPTPNNEPQMSAPNNQDAPLVADVDVAKDVEDLLGSL